MARLLTHFTELLPRSLIELSWSWTIKKDCWRIEEILRHGKKYIVFLQADIGLTYFFGSGGIGMHR